nr:hypothetical protein [uncultured Catenibacterium sp.]
MAKLEKKVTIDTTDKNDSKTDTTVKTGGYYKCITNVCICNCRSVRILLIKKKKA